MRKTLIIIFQLVALTSLGQTDSQEFYNLVKLGEIYSKNVNSTGKDFKSSVVELRTPDLNHIIDALIAIGEGDKKLLTKEFLTKPSKQELKYWYVLREIHYNNQLKESEPIPNEKIAKETMEKEIDNRWLLDNYYYRIRGGIAKMFNDKDLSNYNIDLNDYNLETETEKAILFFSVSIALTQRFQVLQMMKNYDKLIEFVNKLPTFNGKPYYEFKSFDFEDFEWIGYDKKELYKERHLIGLYSALNGHLTAVSEKGKSEEMKNLYFNSILFTPQYFKYSGGMENDLKKLYNQSKK